MNKVFKYHPRLWVGVAAATLLYLVLPAHLSGISRVLIAWNAGVDLFLVLIFIWMISLSAEQICSRFVEEDESAPVILLFVVIAALLSLAAIVALLSSVKQLPEYRRILHLGLAGLTVINSWLLVPTMFTSLYAGIYYGAEDDERPLAFPETSKPVFWDFAYFSFTIAAACQTSDVSTCGYRIRKIVLIQTLISFLFNASILGFAINVTAGLVGS
jgi:uncharacterized membrane protein